MYVDMALNDITVINRVENLMTIKEQMTESEIIINYGYDKELLVKLKEAVVEEKKGFFSRIWEKIREMWERFMAKVQELVGDSSKWLEDNKDIISRMQIPQSYNINIFKYWDGYNELKAFKLASVFPDIKDENALAALADKASFRKLKEFSKYNTSKKTDNLLDDMRNMFRGGSAPFQLNGTEIQAHIGHMYNFCVSYQNEVKNLNNDYTALKQRVDQIKTEIQGIETEEEKAAAAKKNEPINDCFIYVEDSFLNERVMILNEQKVQKFASKDEVINSIKNKNKKADDTIVQIGNNPADLFKVVDNRPADGKGFITDKNSTSISITDYVPEKAKGSVTSTPSKEEPAKSGTVTTDGSISTDEINKKIELKGADTVKDQKSRSELSSKYTLYVNEYYAMMSVKMEVMESMHREYMKILRYFVAKAKATGK